MKPTRVFIHCSDTVNGVHVSIDAIRADHIKRGFGDVGYHVVIQPNGEYVQTRPYNQPGCHVKGENYDSIGICLAGQGKYTPRQWEKLRYILDSLRICYNIQANRIFCHYQAPSAKVQAKSCPSVPIETILDWYLTGNLKGITEYTCEESLR